jgi:DNA-binding transcriptional LysR family regulator
MTALSPLDWTTLRDFLAVAEAGSLSAAARRLGLSQPTLTRRIAALEERFQTQLFHRTSRGLELTEAGESILEPARHMEQDAQAVELAVTGRDRSLAGAVRITATEMLGSDWLTPELVPFHREHPAIQIEMLIDNSNLNLLRREADIAVRLGRPRQADLVARKVGRLVFGLYAARGYLDGAGRPSRVDDLKEHDCVAFDEALRHRGPGAWLENLAGRGRIVYRANSVRAQLAAIRAGFGVGGHSCVFADPLPELERVLPDLGLELELWLVTHAGLRRSARIRAVFDHLVERFVQQRERFGAGVSGG